MECLLPYLCMVTVPHVMVGLERMLDYRGVGLGRFHCIRHLLYHMDKHTFSIVYYLISSEILLSYEATFQHAQ